jgi:protocatechuate 3,4-dioxygenase beta subunit
VIAHAVLMLAVVLQVQRDRPLPTPTGTASISGRVTILQNGQPTPVRRARVTLESSLLPRAVRVDTDVDGRFQFRDLPAGSYQATVEKAGFVPLVKDPRRAFERSPAIEIKDGQAATAEYWMQPGAAIEGTVVNQAGDPAISVVVEAQRYAYDATGRRLMTVQMARTDDRGRYRVHTLPPGEYLLTAGPDPLDQAARGATPIALGHTFYPGTGRPEEARPIPLAVGQNASGFDIALTRVPVVALNGRVRQSSGQPVKDMMVRLQRVGGPVGEVRGFSVPNGDQFEYPNVPAGEYWLMGVVRPAPSAELEFGITRISVADQPQPNLVVTTTKGASIAGRVEVEGGAAALPSGLQIVAYDSEYTPPSLPAGAPAQAPTERVDASGAFAFASLFGMRQIQVEHLPATWAVKSVTLDDKDITDAVTEFTGGDRPRAVRIVVTPRTASVRGRVQDNDGRGVAGARVVVFSNDERQWRPRSRLVRVAESGPDGTFAIDGLIGGAYSIAAMSFLEDGSWTDANVLRGLRNFASSAALKDGETTTVAALRVR